MILLLFDYKNNNKSTSKTHCNWLKNSFKFGIRVSFFAKTLGEQLKGHFNDHCRLSGLLKVDQILNRFPNKHA